MTTFMLHYESPPDDPHKLPRPHRIEFDREANTYSTTGGELGTVVFLGLSYDHLVEDFDDPSLWLWPADIAAPRTLPEREQFSADYSGWFANFASQPDGDMFSVVTPISRIEYP